MLRNGRKAQSIGEYVLLLALIVAVLVAMQVYVRRGMQGRIKDASDFLVGKMSQQAGAQEARQFEPNYRSSERKTEQNSTIRQSLSLDDAKRKDYDRDETVTHQEEVINLDYEQN